MDMTNIALVETVSDLEKKGITPDIIGDKGLTVGDVSIYFGYMCIVTIGDTQLKYFAPEKARERFFKGVMSNG